MVKGQEISFCESNHVVTQRIHAEGNPVAVKTN